MPGKRKRATIKERLTPCGCCGHPLSQRHHLLEIAVWGENEATVQLCGNCHELYHLASRGFVENHKASKALFFDVFDKMGRWTDRMQFIVKLLDRAKKLNETAEIEFLRLQDMGRDAATARTLAKHMVTSQGEDV